MYNTLGQIIYQDEILVYDEQTDFILPKSISNGFVMLQQITRVLK
jgi:hypothetical protein